MISATTSWRKTSNIRYNSASLNVLYVDISSFKMWQIMMSLSKSLIKVSEGHVQRTLRYAFCLQFILVYFIYFLLKLLCILKFISSTLFKSLNSNIYILKQLSVPNSTGFWSQPISHIKPKVFLPEHYFCQTRRVWNLRYF